MTDPNAAVSEVSHVLQNLGVEREPVARVETKRSVFAQILVCNGCCCGREDKRKPSIPVDELKRAFKERKLLKTVQLTISGCLGPCDVLNVFTILTEDGQQWFGGIRTHEPFLALIDWAEECRELGAVAPFPDILEPYRFDRFPPKLVDRLRTAEVGDR